MKNLHKLFNSKSIAIVGASPKKEKLGNILMWNIISSGWRGKLYFVNPKYKKIGADKCYKNLSEIKKPVDLALIVIPAPLVNQVIEKGAQASPKIENYVVISSGFKETGKEGKRLEEELESLAEKYKLNILGPNCLGFISPAQKLNATFTNGNFKAGKVAIVSQSGALAVALLDWAQSRSIGFSKVISVGNKTVLDEGDIISYLHEDKDTQAIALYLEDIKDGAKFIETVAKIKGEKPVIVLKAGRSPAGQKAVMSHTGSLAQDEAVLGAMFEKLNVIEAKTISEFQNLILYLNSCEIPNRREVVILTNAGGPGVLASDFIGNSEILKLQKISAVVKNQLKKYLPVSASVENPIDIIGDAAPTRYENTLKIISKKYSENPILIILTPQSQTNPDEVARIIKKYRRQFSRLVTSFMGRVKVEKAVDYLGKNGIANLESPEEALGTIEKLVKYSLQKSKKISIVPQKEIHLKFEVNSIIQSALKEKRKMLFWQETEKIFKSYGVKLTESASFEKLSELREINYPSVLKTDDPEIIHRWDKKAVILGIQNKRELKEAFVKIKNETKARKMLLQPMIKPGLEMIVGFRRDKTFGSVIIAGLGGTLAEVLKDRIVLVSPLGEKEIKSKFQKLKSYSILRGFRGEKRYNIEELVEIILALQQIAAENPDILEIDINPAVLYNDGSSYQIVDAKVYVGG